MAFKQAPKNNDGIKKIQEERFIEQARGETNTQELKPKKKPFLVHLPLETIALLKEYQTKCGKYGESQGYIINEAILLWLKSKDFIESE